MLVDLKTILADTREKHYAVGLFNCVTLEMTKGILAAAEELHSPVIIGPAESLLPGASLAEYADMMLGMARRAGVPVALHFDHGFTPELVEEAIRLGFSSVMYDCSMLPFEENVRRTREMAAKAHAAGCSLEAEIGHVGSNGSAEEAVAKPFIPSRRTRCALLPKAAATRWLLPLVRPTAYTRKSPCLIWTASPVLREHAQRRWCCMGAAGFRTTISAPVLREASPKSTFSLTTT